MTMTRSPATSVRNRSIRSAIAARSSSSVIAIIPSRRFEQVIDRRRDRVTGTRRPSTTLAGASAIALMLLAGCGDDGGEGGGDESSGAEFTLDHTRQQQAELGMDTPGLNAATDDLEEQIQATFEAADRDKTCENPDEIADMMGSLVPSGPPGSEWIAEDVSRFLDEWCP